jgi:hypothetical protein
MGCTHAIYGIGEVYVVCMYVLRRILEVYVHMQYYIWEVYIRMYYYVGIRTHAIWDMGCIYTHEILY